MRVSQIGLISKKLNNLDNVCPLNKNILIESSPTLIYSNIYYIKKKRLFNKFIRKKELTFVNSLNKLL